MKVSGTKRNVLMILLVIAIGLFADVASAESQHQGERQHAHGEHQSDHNKETGSNGPYEVQFKTHPKPSKIIPDKDMVELMFEVKHNGESAKNVELSYRVYAPPKSFWFGTDFPVVEGTQLLSGTVYLPNGHQVASMILPIRGRYKVKTTVRGPEGVSTHKTHFYVSENPQEIINLSVFLIVLFLVGGVGGYFLSGGQSGSSVTGVLVLWVLAVGFGSSMLIPDTVHAHGQGDWDPHKLEKQRGVHTFSDRIDIEVKPFPQPVSVGELLNVRFDINQSQSGVHGKHNKRSHKAHGHGSEAKHESSHSEGQDLNELVLTESHFVHSEGGLEMVKQSFWMRNGEGEINVQLFDGAPHYLVTRFYRPTELYKPSGGHDHGHGSKHEEDHSGESGDNGKHAHDHGTRQDESGEHGNHSNDKHSHANEYHSEHEGGVHFKPSWEAEMEYQLEAGDYTVKFAESKDPSMKWLLIPERSHNPRKAAKRKMKNCKSVNPGKSFSADGTCHKLTLNSDGTTHNFSVGKTGHYRLFTQHLPREFDMTITRNGNKVQPERKFVTGKGEFIGRSVKWIQLNAVQPPLDDVVKSMLTLLAVIGLGFFVGYRRPGLGF